MISNRLPALTLTRPAALAHCTYNIPQTGGSGTLIGNALFSLPIFQYVTVTVCQNQPSLTRHAVKTVPKCITQMLWGLVIPIGGQPGNWAPHIFLIDVTITEVPVFLGVQTQCDDNMKCVSLPLCHRDPSCISYSNLHQLRGTLRWLTQHFLYCLSDYHLFYFPSSQISSITYCCIVYYSTVV